jgi:FkbM family methyltransferase
MTQTQDLIGTALGFLKKGDIHNAEKYCRASLKADPECAEAYYLLGIIKLKQQNLNQSKIFLEIAFSIDPYELEFGKYLAHVHYSAGNIDEAINIYKVMIGLFPNNKEIADVLHNYYGAKGNLNQNIIRIRHEANRLIEEDTIKPKQRILFGMSFSIYEPCRVHDFLLSQALKLRGADIVPIVIASEENGQIIAVQEGENNIYGGIWGGYTGDPVRDVETTKGHYRSIFENDRLLWEIWFGIKPISLTRYIASEDREKVRTLVQTYQSDDYKNWHFNAMPVGQWAIDVLKNNAMVGDERLIIGYQDKLYHYLYNILLLIEACSKALDDIKPDAIVSNDTFYYQWAVLERLARNRNIPCYNHWEGGRKMSWSYTQDEPAMLINLDVAWSSWKHKNLSENETSLIRDYIEKRPLGYDMVLNTATPEKNTRILQPDIYRIGFPKPTALLPANVTWDLAALNKELLFESMIDWIQQVIDFFKVNPQYQLIIKTHPGEKNKKLPVTRHLVADEIHNYIPELPDNIILLEPDTDVSVYDIIPSIKVGLVYTTTTGLEIAAYGKPVVTCSKCLYRDKGFTYDPASCDEYFDTLKMLLEKNEPEQVIQERKLLVEKFFYLYYFRYFSSLNLFKGGYGEPSVLMISSAQELLPGVNPVLDYVTDSILDHLPIVSETRVPPSGGYNRNQYHFSPEEIVKGGKLYVNGYDSEFRETLLDADNDFVHVKIGAFDFYVSNGTFKPGELTWLYNEVFLPYSINPHAYETDFMTMKNGDIVFDMGSSEGFFVEYALQRNARKVFAFEPHPKMSAGIAKTYADRIQTDRVEVVSSALSNTDGEGMFNNGNEFICEAKLSNQGCYPVPVTTFDSFISKRNLPAVDFIKMDVEGEEMNVILGSFEVLRRFKPRLAIAVYHGYNNAVKVKELILQARPDYKVSFGGCYMFETPFRPFMVYAY